MKQNLSPKERELRIEMVRARAAIERQSMARSVSELGNSLQPRAIVRSLFPKVSSRSATDWIFHALTLTRRYPLLASSVSAVLSGVGKRKRWWRIGAGLLLSWQVARTMGRKD